MECEEFNLPDWSPPDNPIQSERAKRASSSIMECEEFFLPDWSPPDDPAYALQGFRPKAGIVLCVTFLLDFSPLPTILPPKAA